MLLVIDIGNTNLVVGLFEGEDLRSSWRVATRKDRTADEYAVLFDNLFRLAGFAFSDVENVAVCSVVPPLNDAFELLSRRYFKIEPFFVDPEKQKLVPILYRPPSDVGADRIVNAVAAFRLFGGPVVVVDFGTATTFDAVSEKGEYLGGIIAPGIGISAEALFVRASRLPRIEIRRPPAVIGDSTVSSMQSGLFYGYVGLVEGILERMERELPGAQVVATGGLARLFSSESKRIGKVEPELTLFGLRVFFEHRRSAGREDKRGKGSKGPDSSDSSREAAQEGPRRKPAG